MIILDTNVISEAFREQKDAHVAAWLTEQNPAKLYLTTITLAELQRGMIRLATGKRRQAIADWIEHDLRQAFAGRILSFDESAAILWGQLMGESDKKGNPKSAFDMQIAAIALYHGFTLATRNVKDFKGLGLPLINPWKD
jgi:predicted nucleic acid-binding protein